MNVRSRRSTLIATGISCWQSDGRQGWLYAYTDTRTARCLSAMGYTFAKRGKDLFKSNSAMNEVD
jgi:hypothetical protein